VENYNIPRKISRILECPNVMFEKTQGSSLKTS
jgi:hypothetical protein